MMLPGFTGLPPIRAASAVTASAVSPQSRRAGLEYRRELLRRVFALLAQLYGAQRRGPSPTAPGAPGTTWAPYVPRNPAEAERVRMFDLIRTAQAARNPATGMYDNPYDALIAWYATMLSNRR